MPLQLRIVQMHKCASPCPFLMIAGALAIASILILGWPVRAALEAGMRNWTGGQCTGSAHAMAHWIWASTGQAPAHGMPVASYL